MLLAVAATCLASRTQAQEGGTSASIERLLGDSAEYRRVFEELQRAVTAHDAACVAALVHYPITVAIGKSRRVIKSSARFIAKYDSIMTPAIADTIRQAKYDALFVNYQGVMLGRGEVWIRGACRDKACKVAPVRVYTIQSTADPAPAETPAR